MKKYVYFLSTLVFCVLLVAQGNSPKIYIGKPVFNFGYVLEGTFMVHKFQVQNKGGKPLHIKKIRTTCACTNAPIKDKIIQPGSETTVSLFFNNSRYFHRIAKAAIISSDDPRAPSEKITIIAHMDTTKPRVITPDPWTIKLGFGKNISRTGHVTIINSSNSEIKLRLIDYFDDVLKKPQISDETVPPRQKTKITVTLRDEITGVKFIKASFTVAAFDKKNSELTRITIPVSGGGS